MTTPNQSLKLFSTIAMRNVLKEIIPEFEKRTDAHVTIEYGATAQLSERIRAGARADIERLRADFDVVILDRYVASNAAYSAARLHQGVDGEVVSWIRALEFDRFAMPVPDWQVLLAVPTDLAAQRAQRRAETDADRARDAYERDDGLQRRTSEAYAALAAQNWCGPWHVAGPDTTAAELASALRA